MTPQAFDLTQPMTQVIRQAQTSFFSGLRQMNEAYLNGLRQAHALAVQGRMLPNSVLESAQFEKTLDQARGFLQTQSKALEVLVAV